MSNATTSPDATARVHEVNKKHLAYLPSEFLASLNALEYSKLSPSNNAMLLDKWKAAPAPTPLERLHEQNEARALHRLAQGDSVEIDDAGRLTPSLSAQDRMKLLDAQNATGGPAKRPASPAPLRRDELPAQFRNLQGAKLMDAIARVADADRAKVALDSGRHISDQERRRLADVVTMGGGGSGRSAL